MNRAKIEAPTTVITPQTTMLRLLMAPQMVPIFHRLGSTQCMGRTADGDTLGYRLLDGEKLRNFSAKILPSTPVTMITTTRHRHMTAQLLRNANTDGGSDALGQEGDVGRMVEMEDEGEEEHGARLANTPETMPISTAR